MSQIPVHMLKNVMLDNTSILTALNHLQRTLQSSFCTSLKGAAFYDLEVRRPPSTNEVYTTLRSLVHVPCWAAAMPRRHFAVQTLCGFLFTEHMFTCFEFANCLCLEHAPESPRMRSKYVQMVFVVVARGFHFRDAFLHLQEVTRWHTNFVQRGSFDFAISGGQKGVGNIGNFMHFHAMSYQY